MRRNRRDPTALYKRRAFTAAKATNKTTANANLSISPLVATENAVRIDLVTESPNVEDDGRAVMLHPDLLASPFRSKSQLEAENAALRHQLTVLRRKVRGRVQFSKDDRLFLILLYRWFPSILKAITIIRPETLVRWHRAGFRQ